MSQYFIPPRPTSHRPHQTETYNEQRHDDDLSATVYIFPSPPSDSEGASDRDAQSPYSTSSLLDASLPTDLSLSSGEESWDELGHGMGGEMEVEVDEVDFWDWDGRSFDDEPHLERGSRWDGVHRRPLLTEATPIAYMNGRWHIGRPIQALSTSRSRTRTRTRPVSRHRSPAPHPPLRIPLLSLFSSLLNLDDSTLRLITRPSLSHSSPLFPGPRLYITGTDSDPAHTPPDLNELRSLKEGICVGCDHSVNPNNPFALSFEGLLRFVSGVWTSSSRVLYYNVIRRGPAGKQR